MRYGLLVMAWILGLALLPGTVRTVGGTFGPPLVPTRFDDPIPDGCVADDCSLREAIIAANEEDNLVKVDLPAGTYTLSIEGREEDLAATGDLDLVDRLWLSGAGEGETIIEAEGIDRVFDVGAGNIEISGLTIRGGHAQTPDLESGSGGGLFVGRSATLTLVRVTVLENAADGQGGGIYNASDSLTLIECTITGNREGSKNGFSVPGGGGIHNIGEATLIETTVSDNVARGSAGGISNTGSMTLIDSRVVGNTAAVGGGIGNGGGIATLMLTNTVVSGNVSLTGGGGLGGGGVIEIVGSSFSDNVADQLGGAINFGGSTLMTIEDSIFSGNFAGTDGGAINNEFGSMIEMTNVTFSGNSAGRAGGAIFVQTGSLQMTNVTVAQNESPTEAAGDSVGGFPIPPPPPEPGGAGIYNQSGSVFLTNTIVAGNTGGNCFGFITSDGHNLDDATSCGLTATGDISGEDPLLGPLADNGGLSQTHALLPGSPAIDAGDDKACPATDQRGVSRPQDGDNNGEAICDIGVFELAVDELPTATPMPTATPTPTPTTTPTPRPSLAGDVNCNGIVDSVDAALILQFSAALLGSLPCTDNADMNGDGIIDPLDAALILQFVAGLLNSLAVGGS